MKNPAGFYIFNYQRGYNKAQEDYRNEYLVVPRYDSRQGDAFNEGYEDGWNNACDVKRGRYV